MKLIGSVCRREITVNTDGIQHVSDFRRILPQVKHEKSEKFLFSILIG